MTQIPDSSEGRAALARAIGRAVKPVMRRWPPLAIVFVSLAVYATITHAAPAELRNLMTAVVLPLMPAELTGCWERLRRS